MAINKLFQWLQLRGFLGLSQVPGKAFLACSLSFFVACSTTAPPAQKTSPITSTAPANPANSANQAQNTSANQSTSTTTPAPVTKPPVKLALVLGGGAARGFAHIGVIQVLEEHGIKPDMVVGTSAGSLVASLYAVGKTGRAMQKIAEDMDESDITDWTLPFFNRGGLLRGDAYAKYVATLVSNRRIEQAVMPLGIVATNLKTGEGVLFRRGDIATAVRASSAVPGVFPPVKIGSQEYVDGGLVSPVPVRYARQMGATVVLAVDISSSPEGEASDSVLQILLKTFSIMAKSINEFEVKDADVALKPALVGVSSADFTAKKRAIAAGRAAMQEELPRLKLLIAP